MSKTVTIRHQIGFHSDFPDALANQRPASIGTLRPGTVVPVEKETEGYLFEKELQFSTPEGSIEKISVSSNIWYQDKNGWWYWKGATMTRDDVGGSIEVPRPPEPVIPVVIPENTFDWIEQMKLPNRIPSHWFSTKGKGVKIAIIDAGFDLSDPCFSHLKNKVKCYDLRKNIYKDEEQFKRTDFIDTLQGNDIMPHNIHGTSCLGVLASQHPTKELMGIAPKADFHLFNIYEHHVGPFNTIIIRRSMELFEKAIHLISKMDMDFVSVSVTFPSNDTLPDSIISNVAQSDTIWFWSLKSNSFPSLDQYVLDPSYPISFFDIVKVGTLKENNLSFPNDLIVGENEKEAVDFIFPKNKISITKGKKGIIHNTNIQCSYATPLLTGLAALKLSRLKKDPLFIFNKKTFISELLSETTTHYKNFIPGNDSYSFVRLTENPIA